MEMLAAQAAHREDNSAVGDEDSIIADNRLSNAEKQTMLQKSLQMAASNGDIERVSRLVDGSAKEYINVNAPDEEGTAPLIYASCFVNKRYTSLVWTNADEDARDIKTWSRRFWKLARR